MAIFAIVPARSGSKGVPGKNIRKVAGHELLAHSIRFALRLGIDRVICSTDSRDYAAIAERHGAETPFLRSAWAAGDSSMEEDVLRDLYENFEKHRIPWPDLFVWLRPTFIFRDLGAVLECIDRMQRDRSLSACRVVIEAESRLYRPLGHRLVADFDDGGRSMIRRQERGVRYRVFNTDVFRGVPRNDGPDFLGRAVGYVPAPKICGLDIDDHLDLEIVNALIEHRGELFRDYLHTDLRRTAPADR